MPVGWAIVVVVQWLAIIALTVVVLGVLRQVTSGLAGAAARPAARPAPDLHKQGPAVGSELPGFTARDGSGEIVTGPAAWRGRAGVLLFLSASCRPCHRLIRELGDPDVAAELAGSLTVVCDPEGAGVLAFPAWLRVLAMTDAEGLQALDVRTRPFAIAVGADGVVEAKRPLNTTAQLTELTAAVLPSGVPAG